jgi:hypothetical protein
MKPATYAIIAAVVIMILLVLAYAYEKCKLGLNKHLPVKWQKTCPTASGFVGAYGRYPAMENCIAWGDSAKRWPDFNRCTYV